MGLLGLLRKVKLRENELQILFLGLDGSGKTAIVNSIAGRPVSPTQPTQGFLIDKVERGDFKLSLWDISGASSARSSWSSFIDSSDGIIFVVDGTNKEHFQDVKNELTSLFKKDRVGSLSWLLLVNKQDAPGCSLGQEVAEALEMKEIAEKRINVMECSALNNEGIEDALNWIINDITAKASH